MTIPKECKRLAEVDFPIAEVSKHAVREKSIRHGHPSTLHLWWARRPLASSRAMLMALLLPDPADPNCPPAFSEQARAVLLAHRGRPAGWDALLGDDEGLRKGLLKFIGDFANWDYAADPQWLKTARDLVKAAYPVETPLVVDPFAGGGSIPLEALRIGCDAFASDLNPVAVLINKVMLEDIPRYGKAKIKITKNDGSEVEADGLVEALRIAGAEVKAAAEKKLAEFYPPDPDGSRPIAYLWARTVRCEAPNCGAEIPLVRSFWLSKKTGRKRALRYTITRKHGKVPEPVFEVFEPKSDYEVPTGAVNGARATCLSCNSVLSKERVQAQLREQRCGANVIFDEYGHRVGGAYLIAVVVSTPGYTGRKFRSALVEDYQCVWNAGRMPHSNPLLSAELNSTRPSPNARGLTAPTRYGAATFSDLFTARQQLSLSTIAQNVTKGNERGRVLTALLSLALGRCADQTSAHVSWIPDIEAIGHTFPRQAVQMVWDFVESVPIGEQSANYGAAIEWIARVIERIRISVAHPAQVQQEDARELSLPDYSTNLLFTDPPYYDAVPYADLSDFFLVWLGMAMPEMLAFSPKFATNDGLSPKDRECVWNQAHTADGVPKTAAFFERSMQEAFTESQRVLMRDGVGCVVFAHKSTDGWEALLSALLNAGWVIQSSWPIATERSVRTNAQNTASLQSSIHLVCRPRLGSNAIGDWQLVFRELPTRVAAWMERLEPEGIRGADLVFACIGPALELYSQYSQVVDAEDRPIPLGGDPAASEPHKRGYLTYVWETVARLALQRVLGTAEAGASNGATGALEEDARLTALFLWTLQATDVEDLPAAPTEDDEPAAEEAEDDDDESAGAAKKRKGGLSLPFDVARRFAQPLGIHLPVWEGRIIKTDKGVVQLLPVGERARQLFGADGADAVAGELERSPLKARDLQLGLFAEQPAVAAPARSGRRSAIADEDLGFAPGSTTLDRLHAAMLLQKSGRTNALRALLAAEQERGPAFLRLANSLSGLYPKQSEEKRLVDAMLLLYPK